MITELGLGGSPLGNRGTAIGEPQADAISRVGLGPGHSLLRHRASLWTWARRSAPRPRAAMEAARRVRRFVEGGADTDTSAARDGGLRALGGRSAVRMPLRLFVRRGAALSSKDSLQRLGIERIEIALIHDVDVFTHGEAAARAFAEAMAGAYRALADLRDQKVVKAIGVGVNEWEPCHQAASDGRLRLLPLGGSLHAARAGAARRFSSPMREAGCRGGCRRRIQQRHSRDRDRDLAPDTIMGARHRKFSKRCAGSRLSARVTTRRFRPLRINSCSPTRRWLRTFPARAPASKSSRPSLGRPIGFQANSGTSFAAPACCATTPPFRTDSRATARQWYGLADDFSEGLDQRRGKGAVIDVKGQTHEAAVGGLFQCGLDRGE